MKKSILVFVMAGLLGVPSYMIQAGQIEYSIQAEEQKQEYLPASYNMQAFASSVQDQKSEGLCWSYVANGLLEGAIMKKEGIIDKNAIHFSASHMDYATSKTYAGRYGFDRSTGEGGYFNIAVAYWNRGLYNGPVNVSEVGGESELRKRLPLIRPADYYVTRTASLEELESSSTKQEKAAYIEDIKRLVYRYGAAAVSFYCNSYSEEPEDYSVYPYHAARQVAYYCQNEQTANHGGIIVGWNDNYPRENFNKSNQPSMDGAFLVKNSWGSGWGNNGYFWVSYETAFCNVNAIAAVTDRSFFDQIYEYDKCGMTGSVSYSEKLTTNAYMNRFSVEEGSGGFLTAVSTYAVTGGNYYKVYISTDGSEKHLKEVKLKDMGAYDSDKGYYAEYAGFMTLQLKQPIRLKGGAFIAAIEVTKGEGQKDNSLIPVEVNYPGYSQQVTSQTGTGFIGADIDALLWGRKYDLGSEGKNICLKAYIKAD